MHVCFISVCLRVDQCACARMYVQLCVHVGTYIFCSPPPLTNTPQRLMGSYMYIATAPTFEITWPPHDETIAPEEAVVLLRMGKVLRSGILHST